MQKTLITLALLFLFSIGKAQTIRFEGFIIDSTGHGLEMANIMVVNQNTKVMDSYGITNDKGKFQLSLKSNSNYSVKISYLGYKAKEISLKTGTEDIIQNIIMESSGIELDGVEIVREMPVSINGDTITYNTDSFKTGTEIKLGDVLKKLPGIQVNADGEVEVEGKKVTKLTVEGKDFFDGDTKLGVQNIPADAVDKVEVLRNYNEVSAMKGLENNENNIAINIKLKEGKKNFWFGDLTAGASIGDGDRYIVNPKLFYYSPKYSLNFIGNFNNNGEVSFTPQDYLKFTGGFKNMMRKGGTNFNINTNDLGISIIRNNRAKEIETQFGATNFSYNINKAWNVSGFGILSSTRTDIETQTKTQVFKNNSTEVETTENRKNISHIKSNLGLLKLSSSYNPNEKLQLDYDIFLKKSSQVEDLDLMSDLQGSIFSKKRQNPTSVNQNLNAFYTMDKKNIFAFALQHLYQEEDPFYNANLEENPFSSLNLINQNRYNLNQNRFVKTNKTDLKLDYYYMLTSKSNINITLGNTSSHQNFNSSIFQILDNEQVHVLEDEDKKNNVDYKFNDVFLGVHYKFITGKFTFNPGFSIHSYMMNNEQLGSTYKNNFTRILPDAYAQYQIKKSESLTYNYSMTNDFTDINQLAQGYTFTSYNSLFRGNRFLENALSQNHSLSYFKYNLFNFTNIFASINYNKRMDAVKTKAEFSGINQSSTPYNSNFADESLTGSGGYGRSFGMYKASVSLNLTWSKFNNVRIDQNTQQENFNSTESFTQSYTSKVATNYKEWPNLEVGYTLAMNDYNKTTFFTQQPFASFDYSFLDSFTFNTQYNYYHYSDTKKTVNNKYDFLDASLIYQKKNSKWKYKVVATNLLNTKSLNDDSFSQFYLRTSQYIVQPRYLMLHISYNL
ncbi:carboxypeptidase-like regulatory domain-containing protein [Flavobacterium sp. F-65]|uniref:Carboxypeptidase-like regulatory domain-containing protein n=1 Tax=Flavobacterium pisciphilum TaxID=2893755 RepID=A0ABS8N099_9FLAO|nr:carboxypeptidase-like regulatory domain-containing protein [Flavobacterium sp. F-65]MCC9074433.1 carboxypeptidase-like regulatory domain-containing protein [Flavobacterium sp. F-65]